jgi:hypothetical protein
MGREVDATGFEDRAQDWLAWARTPGHDAYWSYRDAFLALVPEPGTATLEVGCGEGRVSRDLVARGRLCACITHPMADAGAWLGDEHFAITESYLDGHWVHAPIERDGLAFTFEGPAYPLREYAAALEAAGLAIEALREPADPAGGRWARVPMFLMWRAIKS